MFKKLATFFLASAYALGTAADDKLPPTSIPLPVVAWGGVPADKATVVRLKELGDAGFTINFCGFADVDAALKGLDVAQQAGVKLMVSLAQLKTDPEGTANKLKGHPALAAYYLRDEPDASLFPELAAWSKRLYAADPDHLCYVNLFPTYATVDQLRAKDYPDYLKQYMTTLPVRVLSFDHYPMVAGPKGTTIVHGDWYGNLEQVAAAARGAKVPFWAFALSTRCLNFATPTLANLRCQIFSDLAYGAQGLEYFTYWQVTGSSESVFDHAPIAADGTRTGTYDLVKQVNAEARGLWPVFAGAEVVDVGHVGAAVPQGTHAYKAVSPVKGIKAGGPVVVSHLRNGGREFLVVVNADVDASVKLGLELEADRKIQRVGKNGSFQGIDGATIDLTVDAGDVTVFCWK